jgi:hypothetical protein
VSRSGTLAGEESEAEEREREQQQHQQQQDRAFAAGKRSKNQKVCAAGPPPCAHGARKRAVSGCAPRGTNSRDDMMALSSLLSLCAAAEAMS